MSKKIKLTQGEFVIVDDEDYPYLSRFKWRYWNNDLYSVSVEIQGRRADFSKPIHIPMERFLMREVGGKCVLHKNGNRLDFRKSNLFLSSYSLRRQRGKNNINSKTGYKGVHSKQHKYAIRYEAVIGFEKKRIYLGIFDSSKEAALAYNEKAKELYGKYAYQNKIEGE